MLQLAARVEAPAPERRELLQSLVAWATSARLEPGTLEAHVYEDLEVPTAFYLVARWNSREAMATHLSGQRFGAVLGALDVLSARPRLEITELGVAASEDALARIRTLRHVSAEWWQEAPTGPPFGNPDQGP